LLAGRVPEGFPLSREIPKTGWDAEEERVIFLKRDGVDGWVGGFGTCVELGEDLFWECLADSADIRGAVWYILLNLLENISVDTCFFQARLFGFSNEFDVAIYGILIHKC
jgi:hypothetical protein